MNRANASGTPSEKKRTIRWVMPVMPTIVLFFGVLPVQRLKARPKLASPEKWISSCLPETPARCTLRRSEPERRTSCDSDRADADVPDARPAAEAVVLTPHDKSAQSSPPQSRP